MKPSGPASGENGSATPIADDDERRERHEQRRAGRLRKNGTRWVRIAKIDEGLRGERLDEPAGAEERRAGVEADSRIAKVAKSKSELIGPKKSMKRRIKPMSQCAGRRSCSSSTLSVGIVISLTS